MSKHTPGPWAIHELITSRDGRGCSRHKAEFIPWFVVPADQSKRSIGASTNEEEDRIKYAHPVAKVDYIKFRSDEEVRANAQLIAAAPELLEVAKKLLGLAQDLHFTGSLIDFTEAAIAKAEGQ